MYVDVRRDVCGCGERYVWMWGAMCVDVRRDVCGCEERCVWM